MSAAEVIEQIKVLPIEERRKIVEFLIQEDERQGTIQEPRHADDTTFQAAKERVFVEHRELLRRLAQ